MGGLPESLTQELLVGKLLVGGLGVLLLLLLLLLVVVVVVVVVYD